MKFGIKQIGRDAPKWLSRLSDFSVLIVGAFAVYITQIPESYILPDAKNLIGSTASFCVAILKGIEILSGGKHEDENQQP